MMKTTRTGIRVRAGRLEFLKINAARYDWRDTYHLILTLNWPSFAALVLGVYVLLNLVFAGLYLLGGQSIAEMSPGSFADAFFFSVETLATVGYGHMYPVTLYGHCITTLEIMAGMFGMAVITGLIFVRFSRPMARIQSSNCAVISTFDGVPTLMLRAANLRHHAMVEAEFRIMLLRDELTKPEDLKRSDSRILASIVCIDSVIQAPVQSQKDFLCDEILWNRRFVEIYTEDPDRRRFTVDYSRLSDTEEVEPLTGDAAHIGH